MNEEKKYRPFDLEQAKAGKPVITRDGKPVRILCFDRMHPYFPVVALMDQQHVINCSIKGLSTSGPMCDLFMAPALKTGWVNLYKNESRIICGAEIFKDEISARSSINSSPYYVTTCKITWEE